MAEGQQSQSAGNSPTEADPATSRAARASEVSSWLIDMDAVLVREEVPVDGAARFIKRLRERQTPFLVLTNRSVSIWTPPTSSN